MRNGKTPGKSLPDNRSDTRDLADGRIAGRKQAPKNLSKAAHLSNALPERLTNFLEEFGWLLKEYSDLDFAEIGRVSRQQLQKASISDLQEYAPANPNIAFLVGVLPALFMDRRFFKTNDAIAGFAEQVLKIPISRPDKRSQYELVGKIVCEVTKLDDSQLSNVAAELRKIVSMDRPGDKHIVSDWNEVIRRLSEGRQ